MQHLRSLVLGIAFALCAPIFVHAASVGTVDITTAVPQISQTITATLTDMNDVSSCALTINGNLTSAPITIAPDKSSVSASYTYFTEGTYTTTFTCVTPSGTTYVSPPVSVIVSYPAAPATVGPINITTAYTSEPQTITATIANFPDVSSCALTINGNYTSAPITLAADKSSVSASYTYFTDGTYATTFTCVSPQGTVYSGPATNVVVSTPASVDTTGPVVTIDWPASVTANTAFDLTIRANDTSSTMRGCTVSVDNGLYSTATKTGDAYVKNVLIGTTGNHTVNARCTDSSGNHTIISRSYTVVATPVPVTDTTGPVVTVDWPASVTANTAFNLVIRATDANAVLQGCTVSIDSGLYSIATKSGDIYVKNVVISTSGSHTLNARCTDSLGNHTTVSRSYTVTAATTVPVTSLPTIDVTAPRVSSVGPLLVTEGNATTFTATVSDDVRLTGCNLYVGTTNIGAMSVNGSTAARGYTFIAEGSHTMFVRCTDTSGNITYGPPSVVIVEKPPVVIAPTNILDVNPPSVGRLSPTSAIVGTPITFSVSAADSSGIFWCRLYVQDEFVTNMRVSDGSATASHTFTSSGTYKAYVKCRDTIGNESVGSSTTNVSVTALLDGGQLIKLQCPAFVPANHPCTTVYFWGSDGARHPFPHEKVFFSWYSNFNDIQTVDTDLMQSIPLGRNVTYKPGSRLVKFQTDSRVFIVERGGELRPIANEAVARYLVGANWSSTVQDIAEIFYRDYTIGETLHDSRHWSADAARSSVSNPMDNF